MILLFSYFGLSVTGLILGGILTLVTVVFGIISLAGGKMQQAAIWLFGFCIALSMVIFSVIHIVERVKEKVETGVEWMSQHQTYNNYNNPQFDYSKQHRQDVMDTFRLMVDEKFAGNIPATFYANKDNKFEHDSGNRDTLPFIYPYAFLVYNNNYTLINALKSSDTVALANEISKISYDKHFLLFKIEHSSEYTYKENEPEIAYYLFDLKTGAQKQFLNSGKLNDQAGANGFKGNTEMEYISDVYADWFETKNGDME